MLMNRYIRAFLATPSRRPKSPDVNAAAPCAIHSARLPRLQVSSRRLAGLLSLLFCLAGAVAYGQPINDNFANATLISGSTGSVFGTTFSATRESLEPLHGAPGGHSVWYA